MEEVITGINAKKLLDGGLIVTVTIKDNSFHVEAHEDFAEWINDKRLAKQDSPLYETIGNLNRKLLHDSLDKFINSYLTEK